MCVAIISQIYGCRRSNRIVVVIGDRPVADFIREFYRPLCLKQAVTKLLRAGAGCGGSCFPEDTLAQDAESSALTVREGVAVNGKRFTRLDPERLKGNMAAPILVGLRDIYQPDKARKAGFVYASVRLA